MPRGRHFPALESPDDLAADIRAFWSLRPVCYLEDLFVATAARGEGAGRALIETLVTLGKEGWRRVYWHTHDNNERARTLYDQLANQTDYVRYDIEF
jgi:GNAT superfamily N-acetyltransferase